MNVLSVEKSQGTYLDIILKKIGSACAPSVYLSVQTMLQGSMNFSPGQCDHRVLSACPRKGMGEPRVSRCLQVVQEDEELEEDLRVYRDTELTYHYDWTMHKGTH